MSKRARLVCNQHHPGDKQTQPGAGDPPESSNLNAPLPTAHKTSISSTREQQIFNEHTHMIMKNITTTQISDYCLRNHPKMLLGMYLNSYLDDVVYFSPETVKCHDTTLEH